MKRTTDELLGDLKAREERVGRDGIIVSVLADHYLIRIEGSGEVQQVWPTTHNPIPSTSAQRSSLEDRRCVVQRTRERWYMADILGPESGSAGYLGSTEPAQPVITAVIPTPSGFWVQWDEVPNTEYYEVYTNDTEGGLSPRKLNNTTATNTVISYEDSQGYVAVRAIGLDGEPSEVSNWAMCDDTPGMPLVFASDLRREGHFFSWNNQSYTDKVRLYRDDDGSGDPTNQVWEGTGEEALVSYNAAAGDTFFCAVAVGYGGSESNPTAWLQSDPMPPMPEGFTVESGIGHVMLHVDFDVDSAHLHSAFQEFIAYRADDSSGTNEVEIGRFSDSVWDYPMEMGTEAFFAISANSWALEKESDKTDWTLGLSLRENAFQDDFSLYGGDEVAQDASAALYWLSISTFEEAGWSGGVADTTNFVEGAAGLKIDTNPLQSASENLVKALDLSADGRFGDNDYVYIALYLHDIECSAIYLRFWDDLAGGKVFEGRITGLSGSMGWLYRKIKKSDFVAVNAPDWSSIERIGIWVNATIFNSTAVTFDDWRIVKADPDDADIGNDTGDAWDFSGDFNDTGPQWHVYGLDEAGIDVPYSLGQIKDAGGATEYIGAYTLKEFNSAGDGFRYLGRVRAFKDDGKVGIAWAVQDLTAGSEDLYVAYLDTSGDKFYLQKAVGGTYSNLDTAVDFTSAPDTWYWIGLEHSGSSIKVYVADNSNVLQGINLKFSVTDTTYRQGRVGVWCEDSKARWTDLVAGSPDFAYTAYLALVVKEAGGYGREDYVMATDGSGRRVWVRDADPASTRTVQDGDVWVETDTDRIWVRESGAWVLYGDGVNIFVMDADPTGSETVKNGDIWVETDLNFIKVRESGAWVNFIPSDLISPFLSLPALRGFWATSVDSNGDWFDLSGLGKTLTYQGVANFSYTDLFSCWYYGGAGRHNRGDEADLDIIGTEAYISGTQRGLTFGGWFQPTAAAGSHLIGKADDTNGPYFLYGTAGTSLLFRVRNAADAANFDVSIAPFAINTWHFVAARYTPSTELKVWDGAATNTNVAGIPASLLNGNDAFSIGAAGGGATPYTGSAGFCFLCVCAVSDAKIESVFQQTRGAFGI